MTISHSIWWGIFRKKQLWDSCLVAVAPEGELEAVAKTKGQVQGQFGPCDEFEATSKYRRLFLQKWLTLTP